MARISATDLILNPDGSVYHLSLQPEHVGDIIIAVGDPARVAQVSKFFDDVESEVNQREFITHTGRLSGKRITVISTGIGPDNVEIVLTELDALVNLDLKTRQPNTQHKKLKIVRIGTSGALQRDIPVGAHLITDYAIGLDNLLAFYDLRMSDFETRLAQDLQRQTGLPFQPYVCRGSEALLEKVGRGMVVGNTLTCPGFYAPQGRQVRVPARFPNLLDDLNIFRNGDFRLTNFEMETAAYYALGKLMGHDVISTNAIIANRMEAKFAKNHHDVVDHLIEKVLHNLIA